MIDYKYKDLFLKSHIDKQLKIATDDGLFTALNSDIHFEDFELTEILCDSSELKFGCCNHATVKFQIRNPFIPLAGKWITITETLEGNTDVPFQYGRYKVFSDKPTADREYRDIVAYDAMYDILNADMVAWYNALLPTKGSTITLRQFRKKFIQHFGLEEVLPKIAEDSSGNPVYGLVNDDMPVGRTIEPEQLSGKDIITAICEINGCFGHIGRDGKFHYIYLIQNIQGLYPADFLYPDHVPEKWDYLAQAETGHLYPQDPKGEIIREDRYIKCQYEDYVVRQINQLQIRNEENDIGITYGTGNNCYVIEGNFLAYGQSAAQLKAIAENLYKKVTGIVYRPFDAECVGTPCLEVGDPVRLLTKYEIVESYIFRRTFKGIQSIRDNYASEGTEWRTKASNSVRKSIIQLEGMTNTLDRNIEETREEMKEADEVLSNTINKTAREIRVELKNTADGLSNRITITAGEIRAELANEVEGLNNTISITAGEIRSELKSTKEGLESSISQTAGEIRTELKNTREGLESSISQTAEEIRAELSNTEAGLESSISQTAGEIRSEVSNTAANLQSQITQNAGQIALRVTKDGVVSAINMSPESVVISAGRIDLNGLVNADQLVSKFAQIKTVKAEYMEVANWTSAGKIKASRIDVDYLFGEEMASRVIAVNTLVAAIRVSADGLMSAPDINCSDFSCNTINGRSVGWETITIGTNSYTVLTG